MKQYTSVSVFLLFVFTYFSSATSTCPNSTFTLIYSEDRRAFRGRLFHIFYESEMKSVAEMIKCSVSGIVKNVSMEEIKKHVKLARLCTMYAYISKIEDKTKQRNYMVTVTNQEKYSESLTYCEALNQFNLMKTEENQWAALIRGHATDIILPMKSDKAILSEDSLNFALNSLFFATAYGFGDSTFKSLEGDTGFKEKLLFITVLVYVIVVFLSVIALAILVVLFFIRQYVKAKKRANEKSNLLRNPTNNTHNDAAVDIFYDDSSEDKQ